MVDDVDTGNAHLRDFVLTVNQTQEFNFADFVQVPFCDYYVDYTVTLIKVNSLKGGIGFNETLEGDNKFASLDIASNKISFFTEDRSLAGKRYGVFVRGHVNVTLAVQDPLAVLLDPFYVTVKSDLDYLVDNLAPSLAEAQPSIEIEAGTKVSVLLGYPVDQ